MLAKVKSKKSGSGQYITRNIVVSNNKILARRGDRLTYDLIDQAEKYDVMDVVLNNLSDRPIS